MLRDLLKGLEGRQPQSVGNMCIIPLVAQETEESDIGTVEDVYLNRDKAYDMLNMGNRASNPAIVPGGYTLITKQSAQDRALKSKQLIPAKGTQDTPAFCVQSSQGGLMGTQSDDQKVRMLPARLRKACYELRAMRGYNGLWNSLGQYNTSHGLHGDFLKTFFDKYQKQLAEFVAEFELVPHQRGAIILVNNKVLGIELSPNPMAFSAQWEMLIRDCYGSEAIACQEDPATVDESSILGDADTLEELLERVEAIEDAEHDFSERHVMELLSQSQTESERQTEGGFKVVDVETEDFVGQGVRSNGGMVDLSLLRRDAAERGFRMRRR